MKIDIAEAIDLLHETSHAVLATQSRALPGYPYATAVPLYVDTQQRPLLLISALAEHTRNLLADRRASLALVENGAADVQSAARLTLVGDFVRCEPDPADAARFLRYQPQARQYLELDFAFFRLEIRRARLIAGIGRMGWLEAEHFAALTVLDAEDEARLLAQCADYQPAGVAVTGIDAYGADGLSDGRRTRWRFAAALTAAQIAQRLPQLLGA